MNVDYNNEFYKDLERICGLIYEDDFPVKSTREENQKFIDLVWDIYYGRNQQKWANFQNYDADLKERIRIIKMLVGLKFRQKHGKDLFDF